MSIEHRCRVVMKVARSELLLTPMGSCSDRLCDDAAKDRRTNDGEPSFSNKAEMEDLHYAGTLNQHAALHL